jgi:hypothetical protein
MASHTNNGSARPQPTTLLTIDDAILLFEPGAQHLVQRGLEVPGLSGLAALA